MERALFGRLYKYPSQNSIHNMGFVKRMAQNKSKIVRQNFLGTFFVYGTQQT